MRYRVSIVSGAALLASCMPYVQPKRGEPHATAKVRIAYHSTYGSGMQHAVRVNGQRARVELPEGSLRTPYTTAIRLRPGTATWQFSTTFFHDDWRLRSRPVQPLPCASNAAAPRSQDPALRAACAYSPSPVSDMVHEQVIDAACDAKLEHVARRDAVYVVQYDFYANGQCTARCYQQRETGQGTFELARCTDS